MAVQMNCPGCGKHFQAPDDWAGRVAQCPDCKTEFRFPHSVVPPPPRVVPPSFNPTASLPTTISQPRGNQGKFQPNIALDHRHQVTGAFGTGFKFGLGWILASILVTVVITAVSVLIMVIDSRLAANRAKKAADEFAALSRARTEAEAQARKTDSIAVSKKPSATPKADTKREPAATGTTEYEEHFEVVSLTLDPQDGDDDSMEFKWVLKIKNNRNRELIGRGKIHFLNLNSFAVHSEEISRISIPADDVGQISGTTTIERPVAEDVVSASATIDLRPIL